MRCFRVLGLLSAGLLGGVAAAAAVAKRALPSRGDAESNDGGSPLTWRGGIAVVHRTAESAFAE